jgi:hypothetical protein
MLTANSEKVSKLPKSHRRAGTGPDPFLDFAEAQLRLTKLTPRARDLTLALAEDHARKKSPAMPWRSFGELRALAEESGRWRGRVYDKVLNSAVQQLVAGGILAHEGSRRSSRYHFSIQRMVDYIYRQQRSDKWIRHGLMERVKHDPIEYRDSSTVLGPRLSDAQWKRLRRLLEPIYAAKKLPPVIVVVDLGEVNWFEALMGEVVEGIH